MMSKKLVVVLITLMGMVCLAYGDLRAQENILDKKITASFKDESLINVIKNIDKQLGHVFSYKENIIPKNVKITINEKNKSVKDILNKVLLGTKVGYKEYSGKIILIVKEDLKKVTVSGTIRDKSTGEFLIGANILVRENYSGASSNEYGFYSVSLDEGRYTLVVSYIGYNTAILTNLELGESKKLNIELSSSTVSIEEVVVSDKGYDQNVKSLDMGVNVLTPQEIKTLPVLFGEQDVLKSVQLMPGVAAVNEGSSGFFVRGGGADQNQILLDEATVYNASHLLGFFSVFNSDAIKSAKIMKGNFPAEYGGRLSSVMDIKMNEGNNKEYDFFGGIGLLATRLTFEGPISKDKGSFIISGRRTYADIFLGMAGSKFKGTKLYFYDLNTKLNYTLGENDRIYLSGYFGRDVLALPSEFGMDWGNITTTIRWNHIFGDKLFMNITGAYSNYNYDVDIKDQETMTRISSGIKDISGKADFQYYFNTINTFRFGLVGIKHKFAPGQVEPRGIGNFSAITLPDINAYEGAAYLGHELKVSNSLTFNYGLRYSIYAIVGPGEVYTFDKDGEVIDTQNFESGTKIKTYDGLEPRFSAVYQLTNTSSVKAAYSRNRQYIHLLSNSTAGTPFDYWQSSTKNVQPGTADQYSIGYFRNFVNNGYEFSVEAYYKDLRNQVDFKSGAEIILNKHVEGELVYGKGWSYGIEFMLKKNIGRLTGWIGYTLSTSKRQFDAIDNGDVFPAKQDRPHDISIVGMYKLNERWSLSFNWIYYTGSAVTFPSGKYNFDGNTINYYTERNGYRMPDYHRLDLGVTYQISTNSSLNVSVYNAYGRKNAYSIRFRENENNPMQTEAVRTALFSVFPSVTYNFRF